MIDFLDFVCIWIQFILLKTENNNKNLLFMLESTVHMPDCTVTIIKKLLSMLDSTVHMPDSTVHVP